MARAPALPLRSDGTVAGAGFGDDPTGAEELFDLLSQRPAWHADALCHEYPEVNFYPERGESSAPAKQVCSRCLVRPECLAFALTPGNGGRFGIWGGTSERERKRLRPAAAAARAEEVRPATPAA